MAHYVAGFEAGYAERGQEPERLHHVRPGVAPGHAHRRLAEVGLDLLASSAERTTRVLAST